MSKFDNFKYSRIFKGLNRTTQILLCITLWLALNFIAATHFGRYDLTRTHRFSLGPETKAYIEQIKDPVTIYVSYSPEHIRAEVESILSDVKDLLREYEYAGRVKNGVNKVSVEYIDVYKESDKAQILVEKYNIDPNQENTIVVTSGENSKEVFGTDLYEVDDFGVNHFKGEQAFTSAILNVSSPEKSKIYWLSGHGEMQLNDVNPRFGLSAVAQFFGRRNINLDTLDLSKAHTVPDDADLVVVAAPQTLISPYEVEKLRRYLKNDNGRVIVLLQPATQHGLDDLFWEWGVLADDMLILDSDGDFLTSGGEMLIDTFADHPITNFLRKSQLRTLVGFSRPVRPDPGAPFDESLTTLSLMASADTSWAERSYRQNQSQQFDSNTDLPGPISLATVSERSAGSQLGLNIAGGRLVVIGNADLIGNGRFQSAGNKIFFNNLINWSLSKDDLLEIPPRRINEFQLPISRQELFTLFIRTLSVPGGVAALGFAILLVRRR